MAKSQHIAQSRRVVSPSQLQPADCFSLSNPISSVTPANRKSTSEDYSALVSVDPDGQLLAQQRQSVICLTKHFNSVFLTKFGCYNDRSGTIRASINIGPVKPPPRKGRLPLYGQNNVQQLQVEADKLEQLGVLARPEDVGVVVKVVSPSFLVKKPDGGHRFVTAFNSLSQYVKILPTASTSCDSVLQKISLFTYLIKTDLTKSFFQIPLAKSSIPYLGTVTPFKGLQVYLRSAMGMPGSSEYLQELTA